MTGVARPAVENHCAYALSQVEFIRSGLAFCVTRFSELVVLKPHGRAFALDSLPHRALFFVAQENPVRHFRGGAPTAFADFVEECRADADAWAVGQGMEVGWHRGPFIRDRRPARPPC